MIPFSGIYTCIPLMTGIGCLSSQIWHSGIDKLYQICCKNHMVNIYSRSNFNVHVHIWSNLWSNDIVHIWPNLLQSCGQLPYMVKLAANNYYGQTLHMVKSVVNIYGQTSTYYGQMCCRYNIMVKSVTNLWSNVNCVNVAEGRFLDLTIHIAVHI